MQQIEAWIDELGYKDYKLEKIKADASLREYYRLHVDEKSFIDNCIGGLGKWRAVCRRKYGD